MDKILLLITTESNKKTAKKIAKLLILKKLAACVTLKNIYSIYAVSYTHLRAHET